MQAGDNLNTLIDPPGNLKIIGDYIQLSDALLVEEIAGLTAADASQLNVMSNVFLNTNSLLTVNLLNGFNPTIGVKFLFLTYGGTLSSQNFVLTNPHTTFWEFSIEYDSNKVYLDFTPSAVPEPAPEPSGMLPLVGLMVGLIVYGQEEQKAQRRLIVAALRSTGRVRLDGGTFAGQVAPGLHPLEIGEQRVAAGKVTSSGSTRDFRKAKRPKSPCAA